jgi:hypothetical protein
MTFIFLFLFPQFNEDRLKSFLFPMFNEEVPQLDFQ